MNKIKLTKEEYDALPIYVKKVLNNKDKSVIIEYPETWEPMGVQKGESYCYVASDGSVGIIISDDRNMDVDIRNFGNMFTEHGQAEEAAKNMRVANIIRQYVFEHIDKDKDEDEDCSYSVAKINEYWKKILISNESFNCHYPGIVVMPEKVADMLTEDLNSGRVVL